MKTLLCQIKDRELNTNKETIDTFYSSPPVQNKNEEEKKEQ